MKWQLTFAIGLAFATPLAFAQHVDDDKTFLRDAMSDDLAEVQLGRLAQEKGQSNEVRNFGKELVEDHEKAMHEAAGVAELEGIEPPREPTAEARRDYDRLSKLSGADFDREFTQLMIADHEKAVAMFEAQVARDDGRVEQSEATALAKETLPTLEKHLETARSINEDLGPDVDEKVDEALER